MRFRPETYSAAPSLPIPPFRWLILRWPRRGHPSATTLTRGRNQRQPWMERAIFPVKSTCWSRPGSMKRIRIGERPLKPIKLYLAFFRTISSTACNWRMSKLLAAEEKTH